MPRCLRAASVPGKFKALHLILVSMLEWMETWKGKRIWAGNKGGAYQLSKAVAPEGEGGVGQRLSVSTLPGQRPMPEH